MLCSCPSSRGPTVNRLRPLTAGCRPKPLRAIPMCRRRRPTPGPTPAAAPGWTGMGRRSRRRRGATRSYAAAGRGGKGGRWGADLGDAWCRRTVGCMCCPLRPLRASGDWTGVERRAIPAGARRQGARRRTRRAGRAELVRAALRRRRCPRAASGCQASAVTGQALPWARFARP